MRSSRRLSRSFVLSYSSKPQPQPQLLSGDHQPAVGCGSPYRANLYSSSRFCLRQHQQHQRLQQQASWLLLTSLYLDMFKAKIDRTVVDHHSGRTRTNMLGLTYKHGIGPLLFATRTHHTAAVEGSFKNEALGGLNAKARASLRRSLVSHPDKICLPSSSNTIPRPEPRGNYRAFSLIQSSAITLG